MTVIPGFVVDPLSKIDVENRDWDPIQSHALQGVDISKILPFIVSIYRTTRATEYTRDTHKRRKN